MLGVGLGLTTIRGRGAAFVPTDIAGLLGWWDASDTATITESGGAVSQLDDKSGNGFHGVQAVAASQPTSGTLTLNGLNVLDFDGGDWLGSAANIGVSNATNFNVFAVATLDVADTYSTVFGTGQVGTSTDAAAFAVPSISGTFTRRMATDTWKPAGMYGSTTLAISEPYLLSWKVEPWSLARTGAQFRLNGADETETEYGLPDNVDLKNGRAWLGAFGPSLTNSRWNGQIAEVIVYDAVMSASEVVQVERYLSSKWGVTLA